MADWQNGQLVKWSTGKMVNWQNGQLGKGSTVKVVPWQSLHSKTLYTCQCQLAKLSNGKIVNFHRRQLAKLTGNFVTWQLCHMTKSRLASC